MRRSVCQRLPDSKILTTPSASLRGRPGGHASGRGRAVRARGREAVEGPAVEGRGRREGDGEPEVGAGLGDPAEAPEALPDGEVRVVGGRVHLEERLEGRERALVLARVEVRAAERLEDRPLAGLEAGGPLEDRGGLGVVAVPQERVPPLEELVGGLAVRGLVPGERRVPAGPPRVVVHRPIVARMPGRRRYDRGPVTILRLAVALFLVQAGFHAFTASLPLALARAAVPVPVIGLVAGTAALVQVPAALLGGRLVDRFGGLRVLVLGGAAYLAAAAIVLLPGVEPEGSQLPYLLARVFQGMGIAVAVPSALSLVPRLVGPERRGVGLSVVNSAHNLTLVVLPPLSIAVLDAGSLHAVGAMTVAFVGAGLLLAARLPLRAAVEATGGPAGVAARRMGIAFRRAWATPLATIFCYLVHWGVVIGYLPVRAELAGADIGLYFAADGIAVVAMRVPTGWLTDRVSSRALILAGLVLTAAALALLFLPPTTSLLVVSGLLSGTGGALVTTPVLVELSRRSADADRGSAFSLWSGGVALALTAGSIGAAPLVAVAGFEAALAAGSALVGVAAVIALRDPTLRERLPATEVAGAAQAAEP